MCGMCGAGSVVGPPDVDVVRGMLGRLAHRGPDGSGLYRDAAAESWFATLKNEIYHRYWFPTHAKARHVATEYIEVFYNRKRHHSTLGYRTPW